MQRENLEEQIEKYSTLTSTMSDKKVEVSQIQVDLHQKKIDLSQLVEKLDECKESLAYMQLRVIDEDKDSEIAKIKRRILELSDEIAGLDAKRISLAERIGQKEMKAKRLLKEKKEYIKVANQLKIFDLFIQAVSKKGIPRQIIRSQLPVINSEISKILQGVTGFTVELDADIDSNAMDIYINYGDSRRIIELASGMEKMMSSLAIRVALINISSLPKTDMLIIDEGFGSLDETNVELCSRLLESLKKWFKNIIVISHIDAVKDAVDNVLDITWTGTNAKVINN